MLEAYCTPFFPVFTSLTLQREDTSNQSDYTMQELSITCLRKMLVGNSSLGKESHSQNKWQWQLIAFGNISFNLNYDPLWSGFYISPEIWVCPEFLLCLARPSNLHQDDGILCIHCSFKHPRFTSLGQTWIEEFLCCGNCSNPVRCTQTHHASLGVQKRHRSWRKSHFGSMHPW